MKPFLIAEVPYGPNGFTILIGELTDKKISLAEDAKSDLNEHGVIVCKDMIYVSRLASQKDTQREGREFLAIINLNVSKLSSDEQKRLKWKLSMLIETLHDEHLALVPRSTRATGPQGCPCFEDWEAQLKVDELPAFIDDRPEAMEPAPKSESRDNRPLTIAFLAALTLVALLCFKSFTELQAPIKTSELELEKDSDGSSAESIEVAPPPPTQQDPDQAFIDELGNSHLSVAADTAKLKKVMMNHGTLSARARGHVAKFLQKSLEYEQVETDSVLEEASRIEQHIGQLTAAWLALKSPLRFKDVELQETVRNCFVKQCDRAIRTFFSTRPFARLDRLFDTKQLNFERIEFHSKSHRSEYCEILREMIQRLRNADKEIPVPVAIEFATSLEMLEGILSEQVEVTFTKCHESEIEETKRRVNAGLELPYGLATCEVDVVSLLNDENIVLKSPSKKYSIERAGSKQRTLIMTGVRQTLDNFQVTSGLGDNEVLIMWITSSDHRRLVANFQAICASLASLSLERTEGRSQERGVVNEK